MKCPALSELPPPPPGKTGWPWTEETAVPPVITAEDYARVTIVTPSYNSIRYLEETIRSVLLQGYPDLEYIIIDGGSTDGALEIIAKYAKWITHSVSEPDRGYADALNKGFALATGDILAWIPASDLYAPAALFAANRHLANGKCDFIFGRFFSLSEDGMVGKINPVASRNLRHMTVYGRRCPNQATTFWRSVIHKQAGLLNANLKFAADSEWFLRLSLIGRCRFISEIVCLYRQHSGQLSSDLEGMSSEWYKVWETEVRKHGISRKRIVLGALVLVPLMRYRVGGIARMFGLPKLASLKHVFGR